MTLKALGAAGSWGANLMYGAWGESRLQDLVAPQQAPKATEGWLIFTGMGTSSGKQVAQDLAGMLPRNTPVSWIDYDPGGVHIPDIARKIARQALRLRRSSGASISFLKLSAGHLTELAGSFHLLEAEKALVRPKREIILSSPSTADDIAGNVEEFISDALARLGSEGTIYEAELGGALQILRDAFRAGELPKNAAGGYMGPWDFMRASHDRAKHSQPIKQWLSLNNNVLHGTRPEDHLGSLALLRENTKTIFVGADNDEVIRMPQAYQSCANVYTQAGLAAPLFCDMPNTGHANIVAASRNIFLQDWLKETGPSPEVFHT